MLHRIVKLLPTLACIGFATVGIVNVYSRDFSRAGGGTFGMFSTLDEVNARRLQVTEITSTGEQLISLNADELDLGRVLALPTKRVHTQFLSYIACRTNLVSAEAKQLKLTYYKIDLVDNEIRPSIITRTQIPIPAC